MIDIREARAQDVASIRDIFRACYGAAYPHPQFYDTEQLTRFVYSDGQILGVEGGKVFIWHMEKTEGVMKEKPWTPAEIKEQWSKISAG